MTDIRSIFFVLSNSDTDWKAKSTNPIMRSFVSPIDVIMRVFLELCFSNRRYNARISSLRRPG